MFEKFSKREGGAVTFAIANQKGYNKSGAGGVSGGIWLCGMEEMPSTHDDM